MNKEKVILIVDDEETIRLNLEVFLEDEGFTVLSATNGKQALQYLQENNNIAAAIVDIRLPDIDGNSIIVKGHKISPRTKYIPHTGTADYALTSELEEIGITKGSILFKPLLEMDRVLDVLDEV